MPVIVHAEDRSGRGDGYYTKPSIEDALEIFFKNESDAYFYDADGEEPITMADAKSQFDSQGRVIFYNEESERITIAVA